MIGKLIFKLPEEREEFELAQRAGRAEIVLEHLFSYLRKKSKYEGLGSIDIQELRDWLVSQCDSEGININ